MYSADLKEISDCKHTQLLLLAIIIAVLVVQLLTYQVLYLNGSVVGKSGVLVVSWFGW